MLRGQAQCPEACAIRWRHNGSFCLRTIGEKAVVADADEAIWQDVLQKATEKLHGIEFHHAVAVATGMSRKLTPNWQP